MIWNILFNVAYWIIKGYLTNSSSSKDEKVLEVLKEGAKYLATKSNNNVSIIDYENLKLKEII